MTTKNTKKEEISSDKSKNLTSAINQIESQFGRCQIWGTWSPFRRRREVFQNLGARQGGDKKETAC